MSFKVADWVRETDTGTAIGTGNYLLNGAPAGSQTFVDGVGDGDTCTYSASDGVNWEVGVGTVTDGTPDTLSRDTILASSNSGNAVNWSTGTRTIACVAVAGRVNGFDWTDLAAAGTTNIGDQYTRFVNITGATTITSFGTPAGFPVVTARFAAALTLTHNGTSLILPGSANIATAAGDVAAFKHEGSGNWRCLFYQRADGAALVGGAQINKQFATFNGDTSSVSSPTVGQLAVVSDPDSIINTTTDRITPTVAGWYCISIDVGVANSTTDQAGYRFYCRKNGTAVATELRRASGASTDMRATLTALVYLDGSTDYIDVAFDASASNTFRIFSGEIRYLGVGA